jgi:hypothetical protein
VLPENPLTAKGALVETLLTVIDVVPVFVTVTVLAPAVVFTVWLPKLSDVGETVMPVDEATPVPVTVMTAGEFVALLATLTLPLTAPAVDGSNATLTVVV